MFGCDNINFWRGLSSSNISDDDIFILLETFNLKKYIKTETMYLSAGEIKKLELLRLILEQKLLVMHFITLLFKW